MSKIKELKARVALDYEEIISPFLKQEPKEIIKHSYELAQYNEVAYMFEDLDENNDWFSDDFIDNMINYQGNIFVRIHESWRNCHHPEHYNFFELEDLIEVIGYAFSKEGE